jgi:hypothetical protein
MRGGSRKDKDCGLASLLTLSTLYLRQKNRGRGIPNQVNMLKTIYLSTVVVVLILSDIWHILAPQLTECWISSGHGIRIFGALLLELSIPCIWWAGWYYWILFAGLTIPGVQRLCFPQCSLCSFCPNYPNWVQTCLLVEGAALMWVLHS